MKRVGWESWSLEPHPDWEVTNHEECLTLTRSDEGGALQLSSARKDSGEATDEDIQWSVTQGKKSWGTACPAEAGDFRGAFVSYFEDGSFWSRWWLRHGPVLLFVTYNGPPEEKAREFPEVERMLQSLRAET